MKKSKRFSETSAKLEYIEGLRALAALYVVISHFCSMIAPIGSAKFKAQEGTVLSAIMAFFRNGHLAVAAFIVLSGFCLQYGLFNRGDGRVYGLGKFFKRRAWRILPAYYAALALSIGICFWITWPNRETSPFNIYVKASSGQPVTPDSLVAHLLLVHNFSLDWMYRINGVLWSIAIEAQLYLLFPWLILVMQKRSPMTLMTLIAIPAIAIAALVPGAAKMYSWFAILFVAGMMAAHYAHRPDPRRGLRPPLAYALCAIGLTGTCYMVYQSAILGQQLDATTLIVSDLFCGFGTAAFLYAATVSPGTWAERWLSARWLVRIGVASYSLYLIHHPLLQVLYVYKPSFVNSPELEAAYLMLVGLPAIVAVSFLFSRIFEKPFVKSHLPKEVAEEQDASICFLPIVPLGEAKMKNANANRAPEVDARSPRSRAKLY